MKPTWLTDRETSALRSALRAAVEGELSTLANELQVTIDAHSEPRSCGISVPFAPYDCYCQRVAGHDGSHRWDSDDGGSQIRWKYAGE